SFLEWLDLPKRIQTQWDHGGLAVDQKGPGKFPVAEICWHLDREDAPLPAGQEMGGLAVVWSAGLDAVVGSDRDVQFLFQIAVVVAEQQAEGAVRVWKPAFE